MFMTAQFRFVDQLDVAGKTVLVRLDVNVPLFDGVVSDDTRIRRVMPGVRALLDNGAKVVILTHFGRPKGKFVPALTVRPVAQAISKILGQPVPVESDVIGPGGKAAVAALGPGDLLLMENLRFYPEEENNDGHFAQLLAGLGDTYIGDAFSCAPGACPVGATAHNAVSGWPFICRGIRRPVCRSVTAGAPTWGSGWRC